MQVKLVLILLGVSVYMSSCYKKLYFATLADKQMLQKQNDHLSTTNNSIVANNFMLTKSNDTLTHLISNQNSQIDLLVKQNIKLQQPPVILTKVLPRFHVNDEDKDWSTQVILKIIYQGRDIAYMECCSAARPLNANNKCNNDHWCDNDDIPSRWHALQEFRIVENVTKEMIDNADYYVGMRSTDGHDRIKFNTYLTLQFSDGSERKWSWIDLDFDSKERDRKIEFNQFHLRL